MTATGIAFKALAAAAGYVPGASDPQFLKLVADRVAAGNPEREDSPAYLLKRLKLVGKENTDLRKELSSSSPTSWQV